MSCPYCECSNDDFQQVNQSVEYSGIEISLNRRGLLRIRTYLNDKEIFDAQDITELKYCPLCGKQFNKF